jgi:hypothetical protein
MPMSLTCKGTLQQLVYLSKVPSPPNTPYVPPLHTAYYVYTELEFLNSLWGLGTE